MRAYPLTDLGVSRRKASTGRVIFVYHIMIPFPGRNTLSELSHKINIHVL
jgi:hypothetical protein